MTNASFDTELQKCIDANDVDKAKVLILESVSAELTDEEKGELYALMLRVYMRVQGKVNSELLEIVVESMQQLQQLDTAEQDVRDISALHKARKTLE